MMGKVTISHNMGEDSTYVSNIFIDEYMQDANDAQLKVYLFLLRMMASNLPTSVPELADKFNHTEKDVIRALKYWEKKGLISLEYDEDQNLTSIHMEEIITRKDLGRRREESVIRALPSVQNKASIQEISEVPAGKPHYTATQLRNFKENSGSGIMYVAEQYFGRPLNPSEMSTIYYIHDELGFSDDLLDYLMQYCVDNHKSDFRYMEKVAIGWNQEGIKTPKQARAEAFKHDGDVINVMKALGMENAPTVTEGTIINSWSKELGFRMDIVMEACERTVMATQKNRLKYCDGILRSWHKSKVLSREDIARLDEAHTADFRKKKAKASVASIDIKDRSGESYIRPNGSQNRFTQFPQDRTINMEELERQLLDN